MLLVNTILVIVHHWKPDPYVGLYSLVFTLGLPNCVLTA